MRISTLDEFFSKIDEIVGGAKNLIVATYNRVEGYPEGLTDLKTNDGRSLRVVSGGGAFNGFVDFDLVRHLDPNVAGVQATKELGVATVSNELSQVPESTFVVLYAGTSRLQKMIDLGASLAQKGAKVALLGCGCGGPDDFSRIGVDELPGDIVVVIPEFPRLAGYCDSAYEDLGRITTRLLG